MVASLAACSQQGKGSSIHPINNAPVGESAWVVTGQIEPDADVWTVDVSRHFYGKPGYKDVVGPHDDYVVVSICSDTADLSKATSTQLALVKRDVISPKQLAKAKNGQYRSLLKCWKRLRYQA